MKRILPCVPIFFLLFFLLTVANSQEKHGYDPNEIFDPNFDGHGGNAYRSASGAPGPRYWQNRADYKIEASLDTATKTIKGKVEIAYTNSSPDELPYVWLQLEQNQLGENSRGVSVSGNPSRNFYGGDSIASVIVEGEGKTSKANYLISDTRMQIRLPHSIKSGGGRIKIAIEYSFVIPPGGLGRTGWMYTKNGAIYDVAQWYPRMEVYDDVNGWNSLPFLGEGEFYCEYGDFDYTVTVPSDMIVVGSGELVDPKDVLTKNEVGRLDKARKSDNRVYVISPDEIGNPQTRPRESGMLKWHFKMKNSRDAVWACSRAFIWDAARINLPSRKKSLAMSVYPIESASDSMWGRSAEYTKASIEIFSKDWFEYPYPCAIDVGGPVGGMEYPGIVFDWWQMKNKVMWYVTAHELGHNWFPMIVGSNERANAWMDEGFNTFIDIYASDEFNHGEYAPKRDNEFDPEGKNPARDIVSYLMNPESQPIVSFADAIPGKYSHLLEYYKTALGLYMLRENVLGHDRFDYAFRTYIKRWAYKHPMPADFFRTMNDASGENLNWFWKGWFVKNYKLDQAVDSVKYVDGDPAKGSLITIENKDRMVMPVTVEVKESNGKSGRMNFPVEVWERRGLFTFRYNSTGLIDSVVVDPDKILPDVNADNNTWARK
ncbi:MAG TPA: M1 family metallopeptidase [Candidatus Acidoferrales bacterium]|nr:M1 family metallopeptidase [Candidatus Acidoferrales bacterium]